MTFVERLRSLGFSSYQDYLASGLWKTFKARYRHSGRSLRCIVCKRKPTQLHHCTYERLGGERIDDAVPLCREHHEAVHEWLKAHGKSVSSTHKAVKSLGGNMPSASRHGKTGKTQRGGCSNIEQVERQRELNRLRRAAEVKAAEQARGEAERVSLIAECVRLTTAGIRHQSVALVSDPAVLPTVELRRFVRLLRRVERKLIGFNPDGKKGATKAELRKLELARQEASRSEDRKTNPVKYIIREATRGRYGF